MLLGRQTGKEIEIENSIELACPDVKVNGVETTTEAKEG